MGLSIMSSERTEHLIEIHVYAHGCTDGIFKCEGKFDTNHTFSDGFKPDDGWYRIADYTKSELIQFKNKGINITFSDTCNDIKISMNSPDDDMLMVQFYPQSNKFIKYMYTSKNNIKQQNQFYDAVNKSDKEHKSVVLKFDNPLSKKFSMNEITEMCINTMTNHTT